VESDKASMEIPSSHAGVVTEMLVKVGDKVGKGKPVAVLHSSAVRAEPSPVRAEPVEAPASPSTSSGRTEVHAVPAHQPTTAPSSALPHASPSIRRLARELGVPLPEVKGSGPKGRITQADVQGFVKAVMAGDAHTTAQKAKAPAAAPAAAGGAFPGLLPWPNVDFTKFGTVERKELSRIKKISGANLHRNWVVIPHVTNHDDADITDLEALSTSTSALPPTPPAAWWCP
jgi:pyruvate dehydrogenase E2 component (dihydrolipoamide acetyltransferase)